MKPNLYYELRPANTGNNCLILLSRFPSNNQIMGGFSPCFTRLFRRIFFILFFSLGLLCAQTVRAVNAPIVGTIIQPICTISTGSVTLDGLPARGTWTLTRSPGGVTTRGTGTTITITGLPAGTYSYTVTNARGRTSGASANIVIHAQPATPMAPTIGTVTQPTCTVATGSVILNGLPATGTWTLTRSPGGSTSAGTGTSSTITALAAGTYTYTVTNAAGCTSVGSGNIVINAQPATPKAPIVGTIIQPTCTVATGSVVLTGLPASGTWTLTRSPGDSISTGTGTSSTIAALASGTYTFTVTNANGCTSTASANVAVNAQPVPPTVAAIGGGAASVCVNAITPAFTDATAGGNWSIIKGTGSATITTAGVVTGSKAGIVTVRYSVANSCGTTTVSTSLTVNALPSVAAIGGGAATVCDSATTPAFTDATASGTWSILNGTGSATITSGGVVTGLSTGTVTIRYTVTNGSGCSSTATRSITVNPLPNAGIVSGTNTVCVGSPTTFTSNGNSGGSWSSNNTSVATVVSGTGVVSGVMPGSAIITYSVTTVCGTASSTKSITVSSPPTITVTNVSISTTLNNCSASVTFGPNVIVTGIPTPGVVYKIGATVITSPHVFPSGTTTVSVAATNSCGTVTRTFTVTVSDDQAPSISCTLNTARTTTASTYTVSGTEFDATATDNCGTPSLTYTLTGATSGSGTGTLNGKILQPGNTTITWSATDGSDNSTSCSSVVTVTHTSLVGSASVSKLPSDTKVSDTKPGEITVKVMPNPTSDYFALQLNNQNYEKFKITVFDVLGRVIEQNTDVAANGTIQLGRKYHAGIYILEIQQGKNKAILRLIKQGY